MYFAFSLPDGSSPIPPTIPSFFFSRQRQKHLLRLLQEGMETTEYCITRSLNNPDNMKNDIPHPMIHPSYPYLFTQFTHLPLVNSFCT